MPVCTYIIIYRLFMSDGLTADNVYVYIDIIAYTAATIACGTFCSFIGIYTYTSTKNGCTADR